MIPPAAQRLLDKNRQHRVLERIAAALDAWRRGAKATALELLDEARTLVEQDLSRDEEAAQGQNMSTYAHGLRMSTSGSEQAMRTPSKEGDP